MIMLFTITSLVLLMKNWVSKYAWFFTLLIISLNLCLFGVVLYIGKLVNYRYPESVIFTYDYKLFLFLSKLKIDFFSIKRIINLGSGLFLFVFMSFISEFVEVYYKKWDAKWLLKLVSRFILPVCYIVFYDPNTQYFFYNIIYRDYSSAFSTAARFFVISVDCLNYLWIILYLTLPFYKLYKLYCQTTISIKKRQILALSVCLAILCTFYSAMFVFGAFKTPYILSLQYNLLGLNIASIPSYYYDALPIAVLFITQLMLFIIIKNKSLVTSGYFQKIIIERNAKELQKDVRSIFHSFKNVIFTINVLATQAISEHGTQEQIETLKKIENLSGTSLRGITTMLNSFKNIKMEPKNQKVVSSIENALKSVNIPENITVVKKYMDYNASAWIDQYNLSECLVNIIQNSIDSIQYSGRENGQIDIELQAEHEWVIIKITDNGIGIPKNEIGKIFKPFYSTKSRNSNWGIGLSYVYRIIKAHKGFIHVQSDGKSYTTFTIMLLRSKGGDDNE